MKPDGRALDIVAIGLGQAGGNLAAELYSRGYRAIALNTAETDLAALEPGGQGPAMPPDRRLYIGLDGYDGAGADPNYGRDCILAHADRIRDHAQKLGEAADAVIICAGLGGGTGSAFSTLVQILEDDDLPLIGLMTLPTEAESGLAKVNAVRSVNEVVGAGLLGWIFVDNGRLAALNPDVSIAEYYARINRQVVDPLDELNRLNARAHVRPIRSFDGEDFRKLLLAGGVLNYATSPIADLSVDEVVGRVRDNIESSDVMPGGFDITRVSYLGLILEAPPAVLNRMAVSAFESINEVLKNETEGAAIYQGIYRIDDPNAEPVLRLLAVTQALPMRIRALLGDAKREGQVIGAKVREDLPSLELGEIGDLDLFRTHARPSERPRRPRAGRRGPAVDALEPSTDGPTRARRPNRGLQLDEPFGLGEPVAGANAEPRARPSPAISYPSDARTEAIELPPATSVPRLLDRPAPRARRPGGRRRPGAPAMSATPRPEPVLADEPPSAPEPAPAPAAVIASEENPPPADHAPGAKPFVSSDSHEVALRQNTQLGVEANADDLIDDDGAPRPDPAALAEPAAPGGFVDPAEAGASADDVIDSRVDASNGPRGGSEDDPDGFAGLPRPPPADPNAATGDLPSPAVYKRLVTEYMDSTDEDHRRSVQRRLEDDSLSDNAVVRYYAVDAMVQLGRTVFGTALLAATEDDDEAVRSLAVQALNG